MDQNEFFTPSGSAGAEGFTGTANMEQFNRIHNRKPDSRGQFEAPFAFLQEQIIFPNMVVAVEMEMGSGALENVLAALEEKSTIIGVYVDPENDSNYIPVGIEAAVGSITPVSGEHVKVLLQGRRRVTIEELSFANDKASVVAKPARESARKTEETLAKMRLIKKQIIDYAELRGYSAVNLSRALDNIDHPGFLSDFVGALLDIPFEDRLDLFFELNPAKRISLLLPLLFSELHMLRLEAEIQSRVQSEMDNMQREAYLREKMNQIQKELGDTKSTDPDVRQLEELFEKTELPPEPEAAVKKELERLKATPGLSPESGMIQSYLRWILELPWSQQTVDNLDIRHAEKVLDENHYGLKKAKDRILEYLAVRSLKPKRDRQPILCFVGAPGTGKTSLGKSIASALERKFVRVSLGGVHDEAEIRGHRRTYIGAMPGRILQTMRKAEAINPVFMLDEIDKLNADFQGDPASALLEVLDPEQNYAFSDHYLEVPYDLSKVLFITTANTVASIPPALLDRMELIEFPGYIEEEKIAIARQFLIPEQLLQSGLDEDNVTLPDETLSVIIRSYTYEAGVRNLEREIGSILRKVARLKSEGKELPVAIAPESLSTYLGSEEFFQQSAEANDEVGLATAIAWTENGGEIMPVEVAVFSGKGNLQMTGQIGEIMQESAQAALSYLKSRAEAFEIPEDFFEDVDIHIHVPEGSIPKDGPSAGITLATALTSAVLGVPVRHEVAMTGEITLRGRVLPIGGVREKVLAAYRAGIKTVLLPQKNLKDLDEVPAGLREQLKIVAVEHMDEVLDSALAGQPKFIKPPKASKNKRKKEATGVDETSEGEKPN